jgi:hypothetical protein
MEEASKRKGMEVTSMHFAFLSVQLKAFADTFCCRQQKMRQRLPKYHF